MKRLLAIALVALVAVSPAFATMRARTYTITQTGTTTNSKSYTLRGLCEAIKIDVAAGATGTVTVSSSEFTLFRATNVSADVTYMPRHTLVTTNQGTAATQNAYNFSYATTTNTYTFLTYSHSYATTITTNNQVVYYGATNAPAAVATNTILTYLVAPTQTITTNTAEQIVVTPTASAAAQSLYDKMPMAGSVTVQIIGECATTNSWITTILYNDK
jgi:hypothetical protein